MLMEYRKSNIITQFFISDTKRERTNKLNFPRCCKMNYYNKNNSNEKWFILIHSSRFTMGTNHEQYNKCNYASTQLSFSILYDPGFLVLVPNMHAQLRWTFQHLLM